MRLVEKSITLEELHRLARDRFGDLVKGVVDVERGVMVVGGELHADQEALLLQEGSRQENLWGINIYPDEPIEARIEFDSVINIRPGLGNRSRGVEDEALRARIIEIVTGLVE